MFERFLFRSLPAVTAAALLASTSQAVTIETVLVGNPGNAADDTGYGRVDYIYNISKYEVTNAQWREFLTAKASVSDPHGLYNEDMGLLYGGIDRTWSNGAYVYTANDGNSIWDNRPVAYVSYWDVARICNWLHNGQGTADTDSGAYVNIAKQETFARQPGAKYVIPTENEWYIAAYYDPNKGGAGVPGYWDYPMMSDISTDPSNNVTTPDGGNNANFRDTAGHTVGSPYYTTPVGEFELSESPYGTFDQGGNLWEWNEAIIFGSYRGLRGGSFGPDVGYLLASDRSFGISPADESFSSGFRVATVPEPSTFVLLAFGAVALVAFGWRRRA